MQIPHFRYDSLISTNDQARELLREYPVVFVSALYQSHGRGRRGRTWIGEPGKNVYCSLGQRRPFPSSPQDTIALMALGAVAVWETVTSLTASSDVFLLKYPNDLLGRHPDGRWRKLAGILVEQRPLPELHAFASIVGIGLNVQQTCFPPSLASSATSLALLGFSVGVEEVLETLLQRLEQLLPLSSPTLIALWRARLDIEGRLLRIEGRPGIWRAVAVHDDGRLEVEQSGVKMFVTDGDTIRYAEQV
ncbi:MAG: biotin--[acetyl-CoA-carboxylase] ligase [Candidatus Kapabacteria bacterium]|nr:biotin--[acetyl-CoA-carboxylase] ligase [Candidatus Kapabacteria bacterium]MDW8011531.1 biotin--[acetyl-CoA-carboxylase] ligase [Bacteroidota bacterium]